MLHIVTFLVFFAARIIVRANPSLPSGRQTCIVYASGSHQDDTPNILQAFKKCGTHGQITFPKNQTYWIATRLHVVLNDVLIDWQGQWQFSDDLEYWRNNSYPIAFQNHHAGFIISGNNIHIDGYGTGGIDGNGDVWYTAEKGSTQPGRPMPFVWWNVTDVTVKRFFVKQPPLWSVNIMNGTNMWFDEMTCNATATKAPLGTNWVQNTDGFDTMDVNNILLTNFVYQGGDDCIAIKPRSYNVSAHNITCRGGNGIAIGSLGQYLEDSSVENVQFDNITILRHNEDMHEAAYIKTWIGALVPQSSYESADRPRGDGWGVVRNISFRNFHLFGPNQATAISQDSGDNGTYPGTSKMQISNISFVNFTGYVNTTDSRNPSVVNTISCSEIHPCYDIDYTGFDVTADINPITTTCKWIVTNGVHGENCS